MARKPAAAKGSPFSIRLSAATDLFVATEARRTKRSKSAIVEALTEEAARMRRFPGLGFRGTDAERSAWVIGTGLDVWQVIEAYQGFDSVEHMVAETDLSERQLRLAIAYHEHYPTEIDEAIAENRRPLDELHELYPFIASSYVD
ncbi:MAG: hypothetical protein ACRDZO_26425 [Egibacteraceae bacterium]